MHIIRVNYSTKCNTSNCLFNSIIRITSAYLKIFKFIRKIECRKKYFHDNVNRCFLMSLK